MTNRVVLTVVGVLAVIGVGLVVATQFFGVDLSRGSATGVVDR